MTRTALHAPYADARAAIVGALKRFHDDVRTDSFQCYAASDPAQSRRRAPLRVVVVGAGAMGSLITAKLAGLSSKGVEVSLLELDWSERVAEIRRQGLVVSG